MAASACTSCSSRQSARCSSQAMWICARRQRTACSTHSSAHIHAAGDLNRRDGHGRTALMAAERCGQLAVVEALLAAGAGSHAVSPRGDHALHDAAMSGKADVIPLLLDAGVDVDTVVRNGVTAFMMAGFRSHPNHAAAARRRRRARLAQRNEHDSIGYGEGQGASHRPQANPGNRGGRRRCANARRRQGPETRPPTPDFQAVFSVSLELCGNEQFPWKNARAYSGSGCDRAPGGRLGLAGTRRTDELIALFRKKSARRVPARHRRQRDEEPTAHVVPYQQLLRRRDGLRDQRQPPRCRERLPDVHGRGVRRSVTAGPGANRIRGPSQSAASISSAAAFSIRLTTRPSSRSRSNSVPTSRRDDRRGGRGPVRLAGHGSFFFWWDSR